MTYTRKMQAGIYCMIADISKHTGHNVVEMRDYLKSQYWGDKDGRFSLALNKCKPHDAQLFYEYILSLSFDLGIEYCVMVDP